MGIEATGIFAFEIYLQPYLYTHEVCSWYDREAPVSTKYKIFFYVCRTLVVVQECMQLVWYECSHILRHIYSPFIMFTLQTFHSMTLQQFHPVQTFMGLRHT